MVKRVSKKFCQGDTVMVNTGADKGLVCVILSIIDGGERVTVTKSKKSKKHNKPSHRGAGGITEVVRPIHISNISHYDDSVEKASRVYFKFDEDGKKSRCYRKSNNLVD